MSKKISTLKSNPKYNNTTQYREMFSPDFAVGWNAIDKHLANKLSNYAFQHFNDTHPDHLLDNVAMCELEDGSLYFITYGLSQLYYDENSYGNVISKYGFELTLRLASPKIFSIDVILECLQLIAKLIIEHDINVFESEIAIQLPDSVVKRFEQNYHYFSMQPDPILKKMGSPHGQHQFIQILLFP